MMNLTKRLGRQRGIGLLELMLSISIISILLIMATRYFGVVHDSERGSDVVETVNMIIGAEYRYAGGTNVYCNSDKNCSLVTLGFDANHLPQNPWNAQSPPSTSDIRVTGTGASYIVTLTQIPTGPCTVLSKQIGLIPDISSTCQSNTLTATYGPSSP